METQASVLQAFSAKLHFLNAKFTVKALTKMKEIIILTSVAASSIFILGYSIHMLIGGLVSEETEQWIIIGACSIGVAILIFMGWDIIRQRRQR
jgi:hypothetical protein